MLATEAGARDLRATDRPEARHAGVNCATARTINPIFATTFHAPINIGICAGDFVGCSLDLTIAGYSQLVEKRAPFPFVCRERVVKSSENVFGHRRIELTSLKLAYGLELVVNISFAPADLIFQVS
jgi:hypothetical protein